ncbi:MAG: FISUMP domain-containing protein [Fibrobacteraceae bacterium]
MVDSRDSKKYRTVVIGTQTWMAENLNCERCQGGQHLPQQRARSLPYGFCRPLTNGQR